MCLYSKVFYGKTSWYFLFHSGSKYMDKQEYSEVIQIPSGQCQRGYKKKTKIEQQEANSCVTAHLCDTSLEESQQPSHSEAQCALNTHSGCVL